MQIYESSSKYIEIDEHIVDFLRKWIEINIPEWVEFQIVSHATYLGFVMGPKSGESQWHEVIDKYAARKRDIS